MWTSGVGAANEIAVARARTIKVRRMELGSTGVVYGMAGLGWWNWGFETQVKVLKTDRTASIAPNEAPGRSALAVPGAFFQVSSTSPSLRSWHRWRFYRARTVYAGSRMALS